MNWPKLIVQIFIITLVVAAFGVAITTFINEIDWTSFDNPILVLADTVESFTLFFDSATVYYPYTIALIVYGFVLGILKFAWVMFL